MCRWAAWMGKPIFPSTMITDPAHSLVEQSREAVKCKTAINADGFGLAWYDKRPEPGLYRDVYPAWSDPNLQALAQQVQTPLFLAHVRASTGTATSRNNCHPFVQGRWSFMHNGQVGGFDRFRKDADMLIPSALYAHRRGATDSEALFLVACGLGLESAPKAALEAVVAQFETLAAQAQVTPLVRFTAAVTDGKTLYAVRYATDDLAPSLFYRWDEDGQGWALVSEPYDVSKGNWREVPKGSFCTFDIEGCQIERFDPQIGAMAA